MTSLYPQAKKNNFLFPLLLSQLTVLPTQLTVLPTQLTVLPTQLTSSSQLSLAWPRTRTGHLWLLSRVTLPLDHAHLADGLLEKISIYANSYLLPWSNKNARRGPMTSLFPKETSMSAWMMELWGLNRFNFEKRNTRFHNSEITWQDNDLALKDKAEIYKIFFILNTEYT